MMKKDTIKLLEELKDYMESRAEIDAEYGNTPNKEMNLLIDIQNVLMKLKLPKNKTL